MRENFTGRLAPSPTGAPHLGNAWSFLLNWLIIRKNNGRLYLRIDDIDPRRSKTVFENAILTDIRWLGLDWDGPICRQSQRSELYARCLRELANKNLLYPCFCMRKELRAIAAAPHAGEYGAPYPGTCATLPPDRAAALIAAGKAHSSRLRCQGRVVRFDDLICGPKIYTPEQYGGDFAVRRSDGVIAYQLATAVDDASMGITLVIRGRDLLESTPRQILIMEYLGLDVPRYAHIPLLLDENGDRLAKRHGSLALGALREKGVSPEAIIGQLARMAGMNPSGAPLHAREWLDKFDLDAMPVNDIIVPTNIEGILKL